MFGHESNGVCAEVFRGGPESPLGGSGRGGVSVYRFLDRRDFGGRFGGAAVVLACEKTRCWESGPGARRGEDPSEPVPECYPQLANEPMARTHQATAEDAPLEATTVSSPDGATELPSTHLTETPDDWNPNQAIGEKGHDVTPEKSKNDQTKHTHGLCPVSAQRAL